MFIPVYILWYMYTFHLHCTWFNERTSMRAVVYCHKGQCFHHDKQYRSLYMRRRDLLIRVSTPLKCPVHVPPFLNGLAQLY